VRLLSEQDLGDVFEEREGGAVPEGRFRCAGFDCGEDLAELGVSAARFPDPDGEAADQLEGPARHRSWSAGIGVFMPVTPVILPAIERSFDACSGGQNEHRRTRNPTTYPTRRIFFSAIREPARTLSGRA
jgi:hypothetical protein